MINKLIYIYDSAYLSYEEAADGEHLQQLKNERKTVFCVEGFEDDEINEYFSGQRIHFDVIGNQDSSQEEEEAKFVIPFENKQTIMYWLPQEPRLFALCVNQGDFEIVEAEIKTEQQDDFS